MQILLKGKILEIVKTLKDAGKYRLAGCIEQNWNKTALNYSKELNFWRPKRPMEKELLVAFGKELDRSEINSSFKYEILDSIKKRRILQTAPHLGATESPRMLCLNWLGSLAVPEKDFYVVGMFSGVPFSNRSRPGRINRKDDSINFFPSNLQDGLVYRSTIENKFFEVTDKIPDKIARFFPPAVLGESYTKWALQTCQSIERRILKKNNLVFLDINEVVAEYLMQVLQNHSHVFYKIFFDPKIKKEFMKAFPDEIIFYAPAMDGKYEKMESVTFSKDGKSLKNKNKEIFLENPKILLQELQENRLCPAMITSFLALAFINQFKCFGSFAQVEYLPVYQEKLSKLKFMKEFKIETIPTSNLTTGLFPEKRNIYPADMIIQGQKLEQKDTTLLGELLFYMKNILLESYFIGDKETMKQNKKAHLIGICGKGMSALALLLKQKGWQVSGSDSGFYDPTYSLLKKNNIKFFAKYSAKNIKEDFDIIVIGKHAKLVPKENEEVKAAFLSGIKICSLPESLGELAKETENTVVAGSFGKSTVTALLSWCLEKSGKNPSYFIGAVPFGFKTNAKIGRNNKNGQFIMEGDEYPAANWDNTSKFLYLRPKNLILISGEHDHLNVFPTEKDYLLPYQKLIALLPRNGLLVASSEGKNVKKIVKKAKGKVVSYGLSEKSSWYPKKIMHGEKTTFELWKNGDKITNLKTTLLGNHNIENIVGVSAFLLEKKLITKKELGQAVETFAGISGRLDLKTKKSEIPIYEGFGSSYPKAQAAFTALQLHFPNKKLITIFEPHTFSWRNLNAKKWYKDIFKTSEKVILLPPPQHGAKTHVQMSFSQIVREAKKNHKEVYRANNAKETLTLVKKLVKKDSMIMLMSSGSLFGLTASLPKLLEKMFPKLKQK